MGYDINPPWNEAQKIRAREAKATLVPPTPLDTQIGRPVDKLGVANLLIILSRQYHNSIVSILSTCHSYVFSGFSDLESIDPPLTIIEALALGIPVIAHDARGINEVINHEENGFLVKPFDYRGLGATMIRILAAGALSNQRKRRSPLQTSMLEQFDSRFAARHFTSIYEQAMRR